MVRPSAGLSAARLLYKLCAVNKMTLNDLHRGDMYIWSEKIIVMLRNYAFICMHMSSTLCVYTFMWDWAVLLPHFSLLFLICWATVTQFNTKLNFPRFPPTLGLTLRHQELGTRIRSPVVTHRKLLLTGKAAETWKRNKTLLLWSANLTEVNWSDSNHQLSLLLHHWCLLWQKTRQSIARWDSLHESFQLVLKNPSHRMQPESLQNDVVFNLGKIP